MSFLSFFLNLFCHFFSFLYVFLSKQQCRLQDSRVSDKSAVLCYNSVMLLPFISIQGDEQRSWNSLNSWKSHGIFSWSWNSWKSLGIFWKFVEFFGIFIFYIRYIFKSVDNLSVMGHLRQKFQNFLQPWWTIKSVF